jgi:hypothetical protein
MSKHECVTVNVLAGLRPALLFELRHSSFVLRHFNLLCHFNR